MTADGPPGGRAAWDALNPRQQSVLAIVSELGRHPGGGAVDFAHLPADRSLFGWTPMQLLLERRGWDNQGNGATAAALEGRGLLSRGTRPTMFGRMLTLRLTGAGRDAVLAGTPVPGDGKPVLGRRSWQVLALLHEAGLRGRPLKWQYSTTIDRVLIARHAPPLAAREPGGYVITRAGRDFYRDNHAALAAHYPAVRARHPAAGSPVSR